jgi:glucosamine 6-phosphate synthetase-like amidotransferase/phosphosugar isomerase protein
MMFVVSTPTAAIQTDVLTGLLQITILIMEIQQIMTGNFSSFMSKEIFEQLESVVNSMRGQINFELEQVSLRSIKTFVPEIKRCRSLLMIACETSYLSCIASRQLLEELTELLVLFDLSSDFLDRSFLFLLVILPSLGGITLARARRPVVSQHKLLKTVKKLWKSVCSSTVVRLTS